MRNTRQCHILFIDNRNQAPTGSWALRAAGPEPSSGARPRHPVHRQISSSSSSSSSRAKGGSGLHRFDPVTHRRHFPPPPPPPVAVQPRHLARATAKRKERERERREAIDGAVYHPVSGCFTPVKRPLPRKISSVIISRHLKPNNGRVVIFCNISDVGSLFLSFFLSCFLSFFLRSTFASCCFWLSS